VTEDLITAQPDGTGRIDFDKMVQRAIEMGEIGQLRTARGGACLSLQNSLP
jgi:hypothetical protein